MTFEDQLARIPQEPPRPVALLPGLRLRWVLPLRILWLPGMFLEARVSCANQWLIQHLAPGADVYVAYLPRDPTRAMLLDAYVR